MSLERPNVWHQRRAQRVRCMPGLGRSGDRSFGGGADVPSVVRVDAECPRESMERQVPFGKRPRAVDLDALDMKHEGMDAVFFIVRLLQADDAIALPLQRGRYGLEW